MEQFDTTTHTKPKDTISGLLHTISQNIFIFVVGLVPVFFLPIAFAPFAYTKILFVIVGVMLAMIFFSLSVLRSGNLTYTAPLSLLLFWTIPCGALLSSLLSGDIQDSLIGDTFSSQSTLFLFLLAFIATAVTLVLNKKSAIMRLYMLILGVAIVLGLYQLLRIVFGADTLSFGVFNSSVATPLGSWNDLGLFFGLSVIVCLVALEQLPLTKWGKIIVGAITVLSLLILAVVNFFSVWIVLGVVSLIMLIYSLSKDRFASNAFATSESTSSAAGIVISTLVFVVSFIFILGGTMVGGAVSNMTGISYVEVRPSFSATVDIAKSVYGENAFSGIGANKFADAWRLYKDPAINQTVFWSTDFTAGNGYVTTLFVTTGILGMLTWLAFIVMYIRTSARMLFGSQGGDKLLFFVGSSSVIASIYLWGMSFIYVPSAAVLILAAVFTGVTFSMYGSLIPQSSRKVTFGGDRRTGFVLVASIMVLIIVSVTIMYSSGRHYAASYVFAESLASISDGTPLEEVERSISDAYNLSNSDRFARQVASYQIARMNTLLSLPEPTPEQQQQFQSALANGVNAARLAVDTDGSDATNWATLGAVYSVISLANIEGAYDRGKEAFLQARALDPNNPAYILAEAQLESRNGNLESAKVFAEEAIRLRPQFTEAVNFLSQIEVAAGNVPGAIQSTLAAIRLEPNNASRYYQLGVLYSSDGDIDNAIAAFEQAVAIDQNFANARYFLALAYVEQGRVAEAIENLEFVARLNPDNEQLPVLIEQLRGGDFDEVLDGGAVAEPSPVVTTGSSVSTSDVPDTPLVSPVNPGAVTPSESATEPESSEATTDTVEAEE